MCYVEWQTNPAHTGWKLRKGAHTSSTRMIFGLYTYWPTLLPWCNFWITYLTSASPYVGQESNVMFWLPLLYEKGRTFHSLSIYMPEKGQIKIIITIILFCTPSSGTSNFETCHTRKQLIPSFSEKSRYPKHSLSIFKQSYLFKIRERKIPF